MSLSSSPIGVADLRSIVYFAHPDGDIMAIDGSMESNEPALTHAFANLPPAFIRLDDCFFNPAVLADQLDECKDPSCPLLLNALHLTAEERRKRSKKRQDRIRAQREAEAEAVKARVTAADALEISRREYMLRERHRWLKEEFRKRKSGLEEEHRKRVEEQDDRIQNILEGRDKAFHEITKDLLVREKKHHEACRKREETFLDVQKKQEALHKRERELRNCMQHLLERKDRLRTRNQNLQSLRKPPRAGTIHEAGFGGSKAGHDENISSSLADALHDSLRAETPNTPTETYSCLKCFQPDNDEMIPCDNPKRHLAIGQIASDQEGPWFHYSCVGISMTELCTLGIADDRWFYPDCNNHPEAGTFEKATKIRKYYAAKKDSAPAQAPDRTKSGDRRKPTPWKVRAEREALKECMHIVALAGDTSERRFVTASELMWSRGWDRTDKQCKMKYMRDLRKEAMLTGNYVEDRKQKDGLRIVTGKEDAGRRKRKRQEQNTKEAEKKLEAKGKENKSKEPKKKVERVEDEDGFDRGGRGESI